MRIRDVWSCYFLLVQRILFHIIDGSIGTQPERVILGDLTNSKLAMDVPANWCGRNVQNYLVKLQVTLVRVTRDFLIKIHHERGRWEKKRRVRPGPTCPPHESQQAARQFIGAISWFIVDSSYESRHRYDQRLHYRHSLLPCQHRGMECYYSSTLLRWRFVGTGRYWCQ